MKKLFIFILLFMSTLAFASDVQVEVVPNEPVLNEPFQIQVTIDTNSTSDAQISYDPINGVDVQGQEAQGESINTMIVNGKVTTKRQVTYVIQMVPRKAGLLVLRNFKVSIDGKLIDKRYINLNVVSVPARPKDVFLEVVPSKKKVYQGEGFEAIYYLYYRVPVVGFDVEEYPKFEKFFKRFFNVQDREERVNVGGSVYNRRKIYHVRLFPEKIGEIGLGQLKLRVKYAQRGGFGGFGISGIEQRSLFNSQTSILSLPLPADNVPKSFSGLVGEHDAKLSFPRTKFLVNEIIEAKLEVIGDGLLENFNPQSLIQADGVEVFDQKSDVELMGNIKAKKNTQFTFMARKALTLANTNYEFSYFNPQTGKYVVKNIPVPALSVSGDAAIKPSEQEKSPEKLEEKKEDVITNFLPTFKTKEGVQKQAIGPMDISKSSFNTLLMTPLVYNILLSVLAVLILYFSFFTNFSISRGQGHLLIKRLKKEGLNYSTLFAILEEYVPKQNSYISGKERIMQSELSQSAKQYFVDLLTKCEQNTFAKKKVEDVKFVRAHFNELYKIKK